MRNPSPPSWPHGGLFKTVCQRGPASGKTHDPVGTHGGMKSVVTGGEVGHDVKLQIALTSRPALNTLRRIALKPIPHDGSQSLDVLRWFQDFGMLRGVLKQSLIKH